MLALQKFLKSRSVEDLRNDPFNLHIQTKTIADNELILFKYNQFNSDFSHQLVKESRGIILERSSRKVVCHPFYKFFNLGENYAHNADLLESYAVEKVDGSLIKVYFYDEWQIATNGTIDASEAEPGFLTIEGQQMPTGGRINFRDLFFDVVPNFDELSELLDKDKTYLFELIHPMNQIVVDYENKKELVFIGLHENDGDDFNIFHKPIKKKYEKIFKNHSIRFPEIFDLSKDKGIDDLIDYADELNENGNSFEGIVLVHYQDDKVLGRVKIKSPKYVSLHHISTGEGISKNLVDVLLKNEIEEFEVYLPKLPVRVADEYKNLKKKYFDLVEYLSKNRKYYAAKSLEISRKELALSIQQDVPRNKQGLTFTLIDKEITVEELLKSLGAKKVRALL